jgi:protein-L-isoaspartate(D-aspartate) O-methyltransferase
MKEWVENQLASRGIQDQRVLQAMGTVPREAFVLAEFRDYAYIDAPLSIGYEQTISQPFIVAYMTALLNLKRQDRVLEIGTGCGYQTAVLAELSKDVYSIEVVKPLMERATLTLQQLGYRNVHIRHGDGFEGWPSESPFNAIILTAAPKEVPETLIGQLADGGRLVAPVGSKWNQHIVKYEKHGLKITKEFLFPVRFVPMVSLSKNKRQRSSLLNKFYSYLKVINHKGGSHENRSTN